MTDPSVYRQQISDLGLDRMEINIESLAEAQATLKRVNLLQKQLRQIKRDINQDLKNLRAHYREKSDKAGSNVSTAALWLFSKGTAKRTIAAERRRLTAEKNKATQPYENVKAMIDNLLLQMDSAKLQIQEYITKAKAEG